MSEEGEMDDEADEDLEAEEEDNEVQGDQLNMAVISGTLEKCTRVL